MSLSGVECILVFFFFFQAEDGIRDLTVTGVQTCALPISAAVGRLVRSREAVRHEDDLAEITTAPASPCCRPPPHGSERLDPAPPNAAAPSRCAGSCPHAAAGAATVTDCSV